jgi:hypothetical protein
MDPFLHREPVVVEGYPEDFMNTFEDFIDCFTPLDSIIKICKIEFGMDRNDLEYFCQKAYGMHLDITYEYLFTKADMYARKAVTQLQRAGNKTAVDIVSRHFAKWDTDSRKQELKITIDGGVPKDE